MSENKTEKAAKAIIDDVLDLSCKLTVLSGAGEDVYRRLHSIQREARTLLTAYPNNSYAREMLAMLTGLSSKIKTAAYGSGDVDISNEDLQHILSTMDIAGDAIRSYLIPRVKPMRLTDGMADSAA